MAKAEDAFLNWILYTGWVFRVGWPVWSNGECLCLWGRTKQAQPKAKDIVVSNPNPYRDAEAKISSVAAGKEEAVR